MMTFLGLRALTPLTLSLAAWKFLYFSHVVRAGQPEPGDVSYKCSLLHSAARLTDWEASLATIEKLMENGTEDVFARDEQRRTFLHVLLSDKQPISPAQFHELAVLLISKNDTGLFNIQEGVGGLTPIQIALLNVELWTITLTLLHRAEVGVDWNGVDKLGNSPLAYALMGRRRVDLLIKLTQLGACLKGHNTFNESLLHIAAEWGHVGGMNYLLNSGSDRNPLDQYGNSPVHHLMRQNDQRLVCRGLLVLGDYGANFSIPNEAGETPLSVAEGRKFVAGEKILRVLNPDAMQLVEQVIPDGESDGATASQIACSISGNFDPTVEESITAPPNSSTSTSTPVISTSTVYPVDFDVHKRDPKNNTELHLAARLGDEAAVRELVRMGADLNAKNNKSQTPLNRAALRARETCGKSNGTTCLNVIDFLVEQGANTTAKDMYGNKFLHLLLGYEGILTPTQFHQIAGKYGQLFNVENRRGVTALHYALWTAKVNVPTLLLLSEKEVDFRVVTKNGQTVLVYAVQLQHQSVAVISKVIEFGADYRRLTNTGESLLHWAAYGHEQALAYFLQKGGLDVNGQTTDGVRTPLHIVFAGSRNNRLKIARHLLDNGADKTKKDKWGKTPFDLVNEGENFTDKEEILELLRVE